jgi:hypothetical protein
VINVGSKAMCQCLLFGNHGQTPWLISAPTVAVGIGRS